MLLWYVGVSVAIVATVFDEITAALARGDRVELRGFGAFSVKAREPRVGRNPRTGEQVEVGSKRMPFFKAGKELRERINRPGGPSARPAPRCSGAHGSRW